MDSINPITWFSTREVPFVPKHFVKASTPLTTKSLFWVKSTLTGRYSYQANYENSIVFNESMVIFFEDPAELTIYELRWSGTNIFSS
jgi:hypothetical protein